MLETQKKVEFIVDWYLKEMSRFTFVKQIVLAKSWIAICTKNEEYEMAAALTREMDKVTNKYLKDKRANRTLKQNIKFFWIKLKRKLKI